MINNVDMGNCASEITIKLQGELIEQWKSLYYKQEDIAQEYKKLFEIVTTLGWYVRKEEQP